MRTLQIYEIGVDPLPEPGATIWLIPTWDSPENAGYWELSSVELVSGEVEDYYPDGDEYDPAKVCIDEDGFWDENDDLRAHGLRVGDVDLLRGQLWVPDGAMLLATAPIDRGDQ